MSDFAKLDERDPFVQVVFKSVPIALVLAFAAAVGLEWIRPELLTPLFVPIAVALFIGAVGFQVGVARRQYAVAVLWLAAAILLFPTAGWLLLLLARVPSEATEAKFIPLVPQAVLAPAVFVAVKKRFEAHQRSGEGG